MHKRRSHIHKSMATLGNQVLHSNMSPTGEIANTEQLKFTPKLESRVVVSIDQRIEKQQHLGEKESHFPKMDQRRKSNDLVSTKAYHVKQD